MFLESYAIADRTVSCGDWLAFIDDGGYRRPELWLSDGWAMVQAQQWEAPLYWERDGDEWQVFTLSGMHALDPSAAVCHVSYYEADAFARLVGSAPADRGRVGSGRRTVRVGRVARRRVAVDRVRVPALSALPPRGGRGG